MSPRNLLAVLLILACLGASASILYPKLTARVQHQRAEEDYDRRLADSRAFIDSLPLSRDRLDTLHDWLPLAHDRALNVAYDPEADPPLNEPLYMHLLVVDLESQARRARNPPLIQYLDQLGDQYPEPPDR